MEKLLPTQLNRPSTQQRPRDPNRFRTIDVTSSGGQHDPEYQQMVANIEALQQRQGWLAGRGAFDKDDLLYMREKEQEQRQQELHKRSTEAAAFAAARARAEQQLEQQASVKLRQQQGLLREEASRSNIKSAAAVKLAVVQVKANKAQQQHQQEILQPQAVSVPPGQQLQLQQKQVEGPVQDARQQHSREVCADHGAKRRRLDDAPSQLPAPTETADEQHSSPQQQGPCAASGGGEPLQTLLAGYGSDESDAAGDSDHQDTTCEHAGVVGAPEPTRSPGLPSAAEVLQAELHSSIKQPSPAHEATGTVFVCAHTTNQPSVGGGAWV